jgi:hypothetical protein
MRDDNFSLLLLMMLSVSKLYNVETEGDEGA